MLVSAMFGAMAADVRAPVYKAPPPPVAVPTWTGLYLGAHAGWGWAKNTNGNASSFDPGGFVPGELFLPAAYDLKANGPLFGGQLGYNWQNGNLVFGIEGDISGTGLDGFQSQPLTNGPAVGALAGLNGGLSFMRQDVEWLASIRGRFGYAWGPTLLYVTGGAAWSRVNYTAAAVPGISAIGCCSDSANFSETRSGWTIGAGYEAMITSNWSVRGEYLYYKFDGGPTMTVPVVWPGAPGFGSATYAFGDLDIHTLRLGVNYKFGQRDDGALRAYAAASPVAPAPLTWTGLYIGGHGGWGWSSSSNATARSSFEPALGDSLFLPVNYDLRGDGAVFGGQLGYNWQAGNWVLGVEGDISGTAIEGFQSHPVVIGGFLTDPSGTSFMRQDTEWVASVRGRLGYTWGSDMFYVTGGAAWAKVKYSADVMPQTLDGCCSFPAAFSETRHGWTIGGGYESMITANWSVRGEYLYYKFAGGPTTTAALVGTPNVFTSAGTTATYSFGDLDIHVARLAVNYKF
jgi:outer membrane immunogenic protein